MSDKMKEDHSMQMATVKKEVEICLNLARSGDEKGLQRFVKEYIAAHDSRDDRITPERVRGAVVINCVYYGYRIGVMLSICLVGGYWIVILSSVLRVKRKTC